MRRKKKKKEKGEGGGGGHEVVGLRDGTGWDMKAEHQSTKEIHVM